LLKFFIYSAEGEGGIRRFVVEKPAAQRNQEWQLTPDLFSKNKKMYSNAGDLAP
jgi:hypothetical protein